MRVYDSVPGYSEPSRTSKMELFVITISIWKPLTIFAKSSILDVRLSSEYASVVKVTSATKQLLKLCHLRYRLRIFLLHQKVLLPSRDIQVFVFSTIPWFIISATSWWVLAHETGCIFEYIFWTTTH